MSAPNRGLPSGKTATSTPEYQRIRPRRPSCSRDLARCVSGYFKDPEPSPSFRGLRPASDASSRSKRANRSADTLHERLLRSTLWERGLRFRKNVRDLPGKPDIVFPKSRLAVFCDGDFWHGRAWRKLSRKLHTGTNASYWLLKIRANMLRDRRHSLQLAHAGWRVLRLWETDILRDPDGCAIVVEAALRPDAGRNLGRVLVRR